MLFIESFSFLLSKSKWISRWILRDLTEIIFSNKKKKVFDSMQSTIDWTLCFVCSYRFNSKVHIDLYKIKIKFFFFTFCRMICSIVWPHFLFSIFMHRWLQFFPLPKSKQHTQTHTQNLYSIRLSWKMFENESQSDEKLV